MSYSAVAYVHYCLLLLMGCCPADSQAVNNPLCMRSGVAVHAQALFSASNCFNCRGHHGRGHCVSVPAQQALPEGQQPDLHQQYQQQQRLLTKVPSNV
jgi:hypothetical protein